MITSLQCKAIQLNNFSPQDNVTQPQHPPIAPDYTTTVFYEFFCQDVKVGLLVCHRVKNPVCSFSNIPHIFLFHPKHPIFRR